MYREVIPSLVSYCYVFLSTVNVSRIIQPFNATYPFRCICGTQLQTKWLPRKDSPFIMFFQGFSDKAGHRHYFEYRMKDLCICVGLFSVVY